MFGLVVTALTDEKAVGDGLVAVRANPIWEIGHTDRSRTDRAGNWRGEVWSAHGFSELDYAALNLIEPGAVPKNVLDAFKTLGVILEGGVDLVETPAMFVQSFGDGLHGLVKVFDGEGLGHTIVMKSNSPLGQDRG